MNTVPKKIQEVVDKIVREYQPEKIILFGSWAWGTPHEDSDVDLFIMKESEQKRIDRERELRKKLYGNRFPPLDLFMYTPAETARRLSMDDFFIKEIIEKGKVLYAK
ncbi:MAG: nucleotidyltransferase domain-containing protein [bacterium]|nr:nucleotidyltransferase domain-containing protein [bacterium]MDZ4299354.1 nucleotidyltransferase domain-containing protein [Candidatus Sungbacteria bacterium]